MKNQTEKNPRRIKNKAKKKFRYRKVRWLPTMIITGLAVFFIAISLPESTKNYSEASYEDWKREADEKRKEEFLADRPERKKPNKYSIKKDLETRSMEKPSVELFFPKGAGKDPLSDLNIGLEEKKTTIHSKKGAFENYKNNFGITGN